MSPSEIAVWYMVFLFSVTVHEAAHAGVAYLGGDSTAYEGGQVSLDPVPHMKREPFGMIVLPLLFLIISGWPFGYASAPYNVEWANQYPYRSACMALAGPMANGLLVVLSGLVILTGVHQGYFEWSHNSSMTQIISGLTSGTSATWAYGLSLVFSLNLILAVLNLLPLPPLDGSAVITLILPPSLARSLQTFFRQGWIQWFGFYVVMQGASPIIGMAFKEVTKLLKTLG